MSITARRITDPGTLSSLLAAALIAGCASGPGLEIATVRQPSTSTAAAAMVCSAEGTSVEQTIAWRQKVNAARAMTDPVQQREAMAALVREALDGTGIKVHIATNTSPDQIVTADFQPAPLVNFDVHLNEKKSVQFTPETATRSLADNGGYYFTKDRVPYVVIGPKAIDSRGPIFIREYTEHELYHAQHHVGDQRPLAERELETWTHGFVNYFHKLHPYRMQWGPLLSYYGQASAAAQQTALGKLVEYYNNPPSPPVAPYCVGEVKSEFTGWMEQRLKDDRTASTKLIKDLQVKIGLAEPVPVEEAANTQAYIRYWVGAGDLNGDGRAEVLRWNSQQKALVIYDYSSGQPKELASHPFEQAPGAIQVADLDGDGINELILGEGLPGYNPQGGPQTDVRINIYKPLQTGGWIPVEVFRAETERPQITGLEVVNFDADAQRKIVFSYFSSRFNVDFVVADRQGGGWKVEKLPQIRMGTSMSVGNVLNDGRNMMVVGRPYADPTPEDVAKNRPTIGDAFLLTGGQRLPLPVNRGVSAVAIGDVNGDRRQEIVVGDGWHSDYGKVARGRLALVRRVGGKWTYELIDDVSSEMRMTSIALADLDGDGKDEIVAFGEKRTPYQKAPVRIYRKLPDGWRRTTIADSTDGFALGDFDGNGRKELVFAGADVASYKPDFARASWEKPEPAVETFLNNPAELVGKPASELLAEEWVGGAPVSLASLRGKVVLLDYWATWCAPCIAAFPELKRLLREYGPAGFAMVGVTNHSQQVSADVRKMVADKKLTWPTAIDSKSRPQMDFGVQNLPHQVLIDQKGIIHSYYVGGGETISAMERDIRKLLGNRATPVPSTAARTPVAGATPPAASVAPRSCPVGYPSPAKLADWKAGVEAAQAMTDSLEQRDAMLALVREALGPGTEVRLAGNSVPRQPNPEDYAPAPVVNFDIHLGDKRNSNTSYFFSAKDKAYVILGPGSLDSDGPNRTQLNAQHELYHAQHHIGDSRPVMDREVEVWTHIFVNTFHDTYPYKMLWSPLVQSYEAASPAEQQLTLHRLVNYYNSPPGPPMAPGCLAEFRAEYAEWLARRGKDEKTKSMQLIRDLQDKLKLNVKPSAPTEGVE